MYCSNCGKELENNVNFCDSCGTPVASSQFKETGLQQYAQGKPSSHCSEISENSATRKLVSVILFSIGIVGQLLCICVYFSYIAHNNALMAALGSKYDSSGASIPELNFDLIESIVIIGIIATINIITLFREDIPTYKGLKKRDAKYITKAQTLGAGFYISIIYNSIIAIVSIASGEYLGIIFFSIVGSLIMDIALRSYLCKNAPAQVSEKN
jgi:hypothetical protein